MTDEDDTTASPSLLDWKEQRDAVVNLWDFLVGRNIADRSRTPSDVIDTGRTRQLHRYHRVEGVRAKGLPVLLVPPLGSQAACFDLRRGLSLAEHLVNQGRPTYLVDYGPLKGDDRKIGIEHFIMDVLPAAIRKVSADNMGRDVHLVGWCMGGLLSIGTVAAYPDLPVRTVGMVASPFDLSDHPLLKPVRGVAKLTGGRVVGTTLKAAGSIPAPLVSIGFKATALPTYLKKPRTLWSRRNDREFLAQIQAVDHIMNNMLAYPGRATLQVYQRMALRNEVATGRVQGPTRMIDLADVRVPVTNVAGEGDVLVPAKAAHHVGELLTNSPDVRLPLAPGGHLGVLTGTKAPETTWTHLTDLMASHDTVSG
ncbi:MAG: alpha/beta fold hydrolase [Aeromicrobium sp.]|uniref:alpha/beta fold hydrolase n=1 Tax=Aeromicrobium sp. TaxID=1871063 RepID=UPI0039E71CD3